MPYPAAGHNIVWDLNRDTRLLDWLDQHPVERAAIFEKRTKGPRQPDKGATKKDCYIEAARQIFSVDEQPEICREVNEAPPERLAISLGNHLAGWKIKYEEFNQRIGNATANLAVEDILLGTQAHEDVESQLAFFPHWKRLHGFWRTLPHYNAFYLTAPRPEEPPMVEPSMPPPPPKRRRTASRRLAAAASTLPSRMPEVVIIRQPISQDEMKETRISPKQISISDDEDYAPVSGTSKMNGRKRKRSYESPNRTGAGESSNSSLTASQQHEQKLVELKIKLQELENEALDKKHTAEIHRLEIEERRQRAQEKHELMLKMMSTMAGQP